MASAHDLFGPEVRAMVGDRLRRTRLQQQISIRRLAELAGISKTSVVQVETGRTTRRSTYLKVAETFGLHLDRLLQAKPSEERPFMVHRRADDSWFDLVTFGEGPLPSGESAAARRKLAEEKGVVPLNILASRLEGGRIKPTILELYGPSEARSHAGEEHVFILSGTAIVGIGNTQLELHEGESVTFWSAEPHSYAPGGNSTLPVRLLSVRVDA